jgi:hypothetical protein
MAIYTAKNLMPNCTHVTHDAVTLKCGMWRAIVATHYPATPFSTRQRSWFNQPWQWHYDGADSLGAGATRAGRSERCPEVPVIRALAS